MKYDRLTSVLMKRYFDVLVSLTALFILSPVIIFLTVYIFIDGGKPIYGHLRVGRNGKQFKCYKFRSMRCDAEKILEAIIRVNPSAAFQWESEFKLKNDPRVTKIGKFLRKTSLDEIPQFFNVLMGDMSIIGPRPVTKNELKSYKRGAKFYLKCKPGVSGLWQVSGRNDVSYGRRIALDIFYYKNWSFFLDMMTMLKTIKVVLSRKGAY